MKKPVVGCDPGRFFMQSFCIYFGLSEDIQRGLGLGNWGYFLRMDQEFSQKFYPVHPIHWDSESEESP